MSEPLPPAASAGDRPAGPVPPPVGLTKPGAASPALSAPVGPGAIRASHADREAVAQVLNQAMADGRISIAELQDRLDTVYAAKTLGELEPVTQDLPNPLSLVKSAPAAQTAAMAPARIGGVPDSNFAVAIFGEAQRRGEWVVPEKFNAVAVMGGVELDLTEAYFAASTVVINVAAIMGGVQITVDESTVVHSRGVGIMGGFDRPAAPLVSSPGAQVVVVKGVALMGGVEIKRRSAGRPELST